jgi:hypothetical protein
MDERQQANLLKHLSIRADALRRAMEAVREGTTPDVGKWGSFMNFARNYNFLAKAYAELSGDMNLNSYDVAKMKGSMGTTWPVQKEIFDTVYADVLFLSSLLSRFDVGQSASVSEVQDLLSVNLRKVIFDKPEREMDVQNAIEALLVGRGYQKGITYDRESGKFKFSGKEFIPDFVFPGFNLALEAKLIKERTQVSLCVEQISADTTAYLSNYTSVLFCIYDLGEIRDINEFQSGLEKQQGVRVLVIKH